MSLHSIPPVIVGAVTFYISIFHLLIYLQRRALRLHLVFALSSFMVCLYNISTAGLYNAGGFASGVFWQRAQFILICLFCIFLFRFVTLFLEHPARRTFPAIAALYSGLAAFKRKPR